MLYSKNGSIPKPETDGTSGWIEVQDPPAVPAGKELVWWFPPGWVIRDPKPAATETTDFSWSQSQEQWVEYTLPTVEVSGEATDVVIESGATASPTIDFGSAAPE